LRASFSASKLKEGARWTEVPLNSRRGEIAGSLYLDIQQRVSEGVFEQALNICEAFPDVAEIIERTYKDDKQHRNAIRDRLMKSYPVALAGIIA
jgi:hypothetical protein